MLSAMPVHLTPDMPVAALVHPLLPDSDRLCLDGIERTDQHLVFRVHTTPSCVICPTCQHITDRVHSRYQRTLADTAWGGWPIVLRPTIRSARRAAGPPDCGSLEWWGIAAVYSRVDCNKAEQEPNHCLSDDRRWRRK
jgi:hypothetical protein